MRELQKEEYVLTKDDVQDLIKGVSGILNRVDERYDLSVKELRILQEKSDIYDSFRYGFYKGMMYQKSKQQNVVEEKTDVAPVQSTETADNDFKLHIINSEYGIASCKLCDLPDGYVARSIRNGHDLMQTLFFYMKERDMIVLNEDNMLSHAFGELIVELLPLPEEEKAKEMTRLKEVSSEYFGKLVTILGIQEYRRMMGYPTGCRA